MLTKYVTRDIVGPAGQNVAGTHRAAGQIIELDPNDEVTKAELARGVIGLAEGSPDLHGGSALGRSDVSPATNHPSEPDPVDEDRELRHPASEATDPPAPFDMTEEAAKEASEPAAAPAEEAPAAAAATTAPATAPAREGVPKAGAATSGTACATAKKSGGVTRATR